jgi:hypothetical protein
MTFTEHVFALERLNDLIRRKATGTPEQLAVKFGVSVGTIKNLLKILKDRNLPVCYCRERQTYYYEYEVEVRLFWVNAKEDLNQIRGGENIYNFFSPSQNFCLDPLHLCTKLIITEQQNDASGFRFSGQ